MFGPEAVAGYAVDAIFAIINLLVAYLILKRFLFKPLLKMLSKRKNEIQSDLDQAEEKLHEADARLSLVNERLEQSGREAADLISHARAQAEKQREDILAEANQEASRLLSRADTEITRMRTTLINDVRDEIADLSVTVAAKVIGRTLDDEGQLALVGRLLDEKLPVSSVAKGGSNPDEAGHD